MAQQSPGQLVENPDFDKKIRSYLNFSVPVISCPKLEDIREEVVLLDTRAREEYEVSHLPGARYAGYDDFDVTSLDDLPRDTSIVVYCSIGYRSEKIGEKLREKGFTNVRNLYGSIFEWANQGFPIVDNQGNLTQQIHTYNRNWSRWVDNDTLKKTW